MFWELGFGSWELIAKVPTAQPLRARGGVGERPERQPQRTDLDDIPVLQHGRRVERRAIEQCPVGAPEILDASRIVVYGDERVTP